MKDFAKKLDYNIPLELRNSVLGVIVGKSYKPVTLSDQPIYATGFPLLVFSQGSIPKFKVNNQQLEPKSTLNIAGQIYKAKVSFGVKGILDNVGIVLHPTATYYLFHKTGVHFLNMWKSLEQESPLDCRPLYNELSKDIAQDQRITLLLDFLCEINKRRLASIDWLDRSIASIFKTKGNIQQATLAQRSGISLRHFRRVFKNVVGMPPKYYCKIIQINSVFELINSSSTDSLHHMALDCGYYDQAHFIKDFNNFIGASPENFLNGRHAYVKTYLGGRLK